MKPLLDSEFLFGASCAPYAKSMDWPMEEWESDFATMSSLHFNVIRIFAAWDRVERREGEFDFSKQDRALELAAKHGLKVVLNFGGAFTSLCGIYPPRHLLKNPDCQPRQSTSNVSVHNVAPTAGICNDTPVYREKAFDFMRRVVRRYADSDALLTWMTWNEPASYVCYCPHTQARFRDWLRQRYKEDLDELNRLWGTEHPVDYQSWDEVRAPTGSGVLNIWWDWMRFNQFRLYDDMAAIDRLVSENDPRQRPTTANIVYHMAAMEGPVNAPKYGLDLGQVAKSMSIMGLSYYTVEHKYDIGTGAESAYKLSRLRSCSKDERRRTLVLESGAGPNMSMSTEAQHQVNFHQLLAHNVKSIILWNYRSRLSDKQVALFNLMKWDGSVSRRARYMSEFSQMLQDNAELLNAVAPERQAAILTLEEQQILMDGVCGEHCPSEYKEAHDGRLGAYKLLWDSHIPTDCLTECQLPELDQYPLLLIPMQEHMSEEWAERIKAYVQSGGTVIAESPFAFRDTNGFLQYSAPGFGLDEVFGCFTKDREGKETAPAIHCPDGDAQVCLFWSEYELMDGAEVLATYAHGATAAVANDYGKGRAILFGTEVFRQYLQNPQKAVTALLRQEVAKSGVSPSAKVSGDTTNVEISRLSGEPGVIHILINHEMEPRTFQVTPREKDAAWINMKTNQQMNLKSDITLNAQEAIILKKE